MPAMFDEDLPAIWNPAEGQETATGQHCLHAITACVMLRAGQSQNQRSIHGTSIAGAGKLASMATLFDISPRISPKLAVWPGDMPFEMKKRFLPGGIESGSLQATLHLGAHADAPRHALPQGESVEALGLDAYLGHCEVIALQLPPRSRILPGHLAQPIRAPRVLFKTSSYPDPECFTEDFTGLSPALVQDLKRQGCTLVGIDTPSVDPFDSVALEAHHELFTQGLRVLEGLDLRKIEPGLYTLIALPLNLEESDGSPVRAVLLPDDYFTH
jgi:arylformamidase